MSATTSLARLFPNPAVLDVLALLLLQPERRFYQREIAELTSNTVLQTQRALKRIEDAGLVEKSRTGNRAYYIAQRNHPAIEDLKRVLLKTVALGDQLRDTLRPLETGVRLSFLFGSIANGTESATSDIDLLLVGKLSSRRVAIALAPLGRKLGREFNTVIYSAQEFRKKVHNENHFVKQILAAPKIWLIGSEDELAKLVE